MANFQGHLTGGVLISGIAAFAAYGQGLIDSTETQVLFVIGTTASLLPDIDADNSKPVRALFSLLGVVLGFMVAFKVDDHVPIEVGVLGQIVVWVGVMLFVSFPLRQAFARLTVHRGVWHSVLMAIVLALAMTVATDFWLDVEPLLAWLAGGFVLLGYLTHLTLDEIASVDLLGRRVKRSFGTALKPLSLRAWPWSLLLIGATVWLLGMTPDPTPVLAGIGQLGIPTEPLVAHWPRW